jgi:gluconolactonase
MNSLFREWKTGIQQPEGPVWMGDGSWLVTEMGKGRILRVSESNTAVIATTGRPNGLAIDADGVAWIAESLQRALLTVDVATGAVTTIVDARAGDLHWPNDLCFGPDGSVFLTDSGVLIKEFEDSVAAGRHFDLSVDGRLLRYAPSTGALEVVDQGLRFANGLAVHPDGTAIYVAETLTGNIYRYPLSGVQLGPRESFANVLAGTTEADREVVGPDGMAFDAEGRLCVAVLTAGFIAVVRSDGSIEERWMPDDTFPTNLAFGGPDLRAVLVTGAGSNRLLVGDCEVAGAPLFTPNAWTAYSQA